VRVVGPTILRLSNVDKGLLSFTNREKKSRIQIRRKGKYKQITAHSDGRKAPDTYLGKGRLLGTECHDDNPFSAILLYIILSVSFQQPVRVKNQQIIGCRPLQYIYFPC
jgi:hypothetical protein